MKILLINPNTSEFVTQRALEAARVETPAGITVDGVTGTFGAPIINSEADLAIGAYSALELAARHAEGYDAVGLAVSFDCGLEAIRELLNVPVVGLAEASVMKALEIGNRYALISFGKRTEPLYSRLVQSYADITHLAELNCIPGLPAEVLKDPHKLGEHAEQAAAQVISKCDCNSVILLATAFAGLANDMSSEKPVIDCVAAMMEVLQRCLEDHQFGKKFRSDAHPERKVLLGVSDELTSLYANFPRD